MIIRHPHLDEVDAVIALFEDEVRAGRMLPRSAESIRINLKDWLVADSDGLIVGCVSLVHFNERLCEVRSLAVDPAYRGNGVASQLIGAAVAMARSAGMRRVLTLTRAAGLFERAGFKRDFVANFPEKVWRDCAPCPFRQACDEVALLYDLRGDGHP
jgi:N-acetylglutamate synthase-like GNAT family acetyltransferase